MSGSLAVVDRVYSEPVQWYCDKHRLLPYLRTAVRLAEIHFAPARDLGVSVDIDPETEEEKLVIDVSVATDIDDVLRRKRAYTRDWISSAPLEAGEKICLLCDNVVVAADAWVA